MAETANKIYDVYLSHTGSDDSVELVIKELKDNKFEIGLHKENETIEDYSKSTIDSSKVFLSCLLKDFQKYKNFMAEQSAAVASQHCKGILWYILDDEKDDWYIEKLRQYGYFNAYLDKKNFFRKDSLNELKNAITKLKDAQVEEEPYRSMPIPELPIPKFVEKENVFERIRNHFRKKDEKISLILTGRPGVGKTTHAAQFAYCSKPQYVVRWVSADSLIKIDRFIKELARIFKIPLFGKEESIEIIRMLRINFSQLKKPTLLILDNVEDYSHIHELLDSMNTNVHYLITTRFEKSFPAIETIVLQPFTIDEANAYIDKYASDGIEINLESVREYVKEKEKKEKGIMPYKIKNIMNSEGKNYSEYNIFKLVNKHSKKQLKIISYLSFLHSDNLSIDILHEITGTNKTIIEFDASVLEHLKLIEFYQDTKKIRIDRITQEMTIDHLKSIESFDMIEIPKTIAAFLLKKHSECSESKQSFEPYISHVEYLLKQTDQQNTFFIELSTIIAETQRSNFRYDGALSQYGICLKKQNRIYNNKPRERTATMLNTIGYLSYEIGNTEEALANYNGSMTMIQTLNNGQPHLNIAETLSNLGALFQNIGNSNKALTYYHESLNMYIHLYNAKEGDSDIGALLSNLQESW